MSGYRKLIITEYCDLLYCIVFENDKCVEIHILDDKKFNTGDIVVGQVSKVSKKLSAFFVNVAPDYTVFLPFNECINTDIKQGDFVLIRIIKDAIKSKDPVGSMFLEIESENLVLDYDLKGSGVFISKKITDSDDRDRLKEIGELCPVKDYRIILRTSSKNIESNALREEIESLTKKMDDILQYSKSRTKGTILYHSGSSLINIVKNLGVLSIAEILTDRKELYADLCSYLDSYGVAPLVLRYYDDDKVSLSSLFSIKARIEEATSRKVWLKSGGYLVIDQTEALNVIDVNSGKFDKKDDSAYLIQQTNYEAAYEVARQIRIRNLSGIIIVDFINGNKEDEINLSKILKSEFLKDSMNPKLIDFTKLHLAEITRLKKAPSLKEQIENGN